MSAHPLAILCELTYRCNLQCPYCYNPLNLSEYRRELDAPAWKRVLEEAAQLGAVQAHLSGGEPTLRRDLPEITSAAHAAGLYVNLITQGTFLTAQSLQTLRAAGLDHVQISIQAPREEPADDIAGARVHRRKLEAIALVAGSDVALTLNCVLHRANIDDVEAIVALALEYGVRKLELANVQFYGWAHANRDALVPTLEQVRRADACVTAARERLRGTLEIAYVASDYYAEFPKPCMNGWGTTFLTVAPDGKALPCPAASSIATLDFENVKERSLEWIWNESPSFNAYRGTGWMPQPCRSCERRTEDWGGCRCQAFLLAGDASATDPACSKSPHHDLIEALRPAAERA